MINATLKKLDVFGDDAHRFDVCTSLEQFY